MTRTLRNELRLGFGALLATILLVGVGGLVGTTLSANYVDRATAEVSPAIQTNDAVLQSMTDMETGLRGYVLSGRPEVLEPYRNGLRRLPAQRERLARLLADDAVGSRLAARQNAAARAWLTRYALQRVQDPVGSGTFNPDRFARAEDLFDEFRARHAALQEHLRLRLAALSDDADRLRVAVTVAVVALLIAGLLAGAATTRLTSRRIRRPLAALRDVLIDLIAGDHDARATPAGPAEVQTIARSVNALADESDRLRALEAAERRLQERLLEFSRDVRGSLDPAVVVQRGLAELGDGLGLDRAYVRMVEDGEIRDIGAQWSAPGVETLTDLRSPGSIGVLRALHRRRRPMVSGDVAEAPFFQTEAGRSWRERTGARASMTVPISVDEAPAGVVTCISFRPRHWTDTEIHLAEAVAADLGRALSQANLYTAQVEAVRRLEALDRAKDDFLSSVSHELRTPLTSINGYIELLEDGADATPQQQRLLHVARRNVDRLRGLIEDLLTLSRIESGAFRSSFHDVDLAALVAAVVDDMRPQADAGGVEVRTSVPASGIAIRGDSGQLSRALLNILGNAIKFTPSGGLVEVLVSEQPDRRAVVVEVCDTGMGIPADDLDRVSTRFFRAGNAVDSGVAGTGLGLVIVRTIVDNHAGSLEMSSRLGEGTTVRVVLPHAPDGAPDGAQAGEPEPSGIGQGPGSL